MLRYMHNFKSDLEAIFNTERDRTIQILVNFSLKCSEKVFKTYFGKLLKWSRLVENYGETSSDSENSDKSMEKKITFLKFVNAFIGKIGRFGINYFGFLFEYFIGFMDYTY
jgi:hypothetical protein